MCRKLAAAGRDITYYDLNVPREHPKFVQDDVANVLDHFEPGSLNFITTRHTLEHSIAPLFQLWSFNRILKEGGQLLVVVPLHCKEWVWFHTRYSCLPQENWPMLFHRGLRGPRDRRRHLELEARAVRRAALRPARRVARAAPGRRRTRQALSPLNPPAGNGSSFDGTSLQTSEGRVAVWNPCACLLLARLNASRSPTRS